MLSAEPITVANSFQVAPSGRSAEIPAGASAPVLGPVGYRWCLAQHSPENGVILKARSWRADSEKLAEMCHETANAGAGREPDPARPSGEVPRAGRVSGAAISRSA
ncbi:hypothetical protein Stsp01_66720 [Streptomyces sp. NBRC 13847]|nr:hypothetical protein Stsp01_66720 [Streptomyces sp. NBRC 13847]